jgi:hypothetical protein
MNISYAITVCNELEEIKKLLSLLNTYIDDNDEIVILCDISQIDLHLEDIIASISKNNIKLYKDKFSKDFASWKNQLNSLCSKEYIFQIDADELPNISLIMNLKQLLSNNSDIELIWIPRENYVDGITPEHIKLWRWNLDSKNRINFPDYQGRIYKNSKKIYWSGKVHETIHGAEIVGNLPPEESCSLLHIKSISKQEKQNNLYSTL